MFTDVLVLGREVIGAAAPAASSALNIYEQSDFSAISPQRIIHN